MPDEWREIMTKASCTYGASREEALVAYLYGEIDAAERAAFERHLRECALCRDELGAFGEVRSGLGRWGPPLPVGRLVFQPDGPRQRAPWRVLRQIPAWAQAAAALLVIGFAVGAANLHVSYTADGVSVRTGWIPARGGSADQVASGQIPGSRLVTRDHGDVALPEASPSERATVADSSTPSDPARSRPSAEPAQPGSPGSIDQDLLRRVRALIQESERRQQRELALRVGEVVREVQAQRVADLVRIDRSLGVIQSSAAVEAMRQRQLVNSLAVRVSQKE